MELVERIRRRFAEILSPHFLGREQQSLVEMAVASLDEAQGIIDEGDAGLQEQINTLRSEYGAGLIGIEDTANNFLSFDVEGALAELATAGTFDPSETHIITGDWGFTNPVSFVNGAFSGSLYAPTLAGNRQYSLQNASGTLAFLTDIPAPAPEVQIAAGANVDVTGSFPSFTISVPNMPEQVNLNAGSNVNITGTYPNLTISATGGSGGGDVTSVNGQVGDVVLGAANVGAAPTAHTHAMADVTGLATSLANRVLRGGDIMNGDLDVLKSNAVVGVGAGARNGGLANYGEDGTGQVGLFSGHDGGRVFIRPGGRVNTAGQLIVEVGGISWNGYTVYHSGNLPSSTGGTVTRVNVNSSGAGITFTGGPITSSGTITGTLSTNLQSWSGINPSTKANDNAVVKTSGNQTGISGNKTFTGNITAANVTATSDVRLKEDIESCPGRKKLLEALRHYRWKWKESGEPGIGVLAQEVQKHAPEYVHEDEEGVLSVDKAGLALEMMFAMIDRLEEIDGPSN